MWTQQWAQMTTVSFMGYNKLMDMQERASFATVCDLQNYWCLPLSSAGK